MILEVQNGCFGYPKQPVILENINLRLEEGHILPMNKLLSCHYNMDTNRVEARVTDGSAVAIDCTAIEDEYGNTPMQRAELDWLLYNKSLEYVQLVLGGKIGHYLSLGCDHGRLEEQ